MELEAKDSGSVEPAFEDIMGHFAQKDIEALVNEGIIMIEDYGKLYVPNKSISRMEIIKMLVRATVKENHDSDCSYNTGFIDEENLTKDEVEYIVLENNIILFQVTQTEVFVLMVNPLVLKLTMLIRQEKLKKR